MIHIKQQHHQQQRKIQQRYSSLWLSTIHMLIEFCGLSSIENRTSCEWNGIHFITNRQAPANVLKNKVSFSIIAISLNN